MWHVRIRVRRHVPVVVVVALVAVARIASATCMNLGDGSAVCCAPGGPCSTIKGARSAVWMEPGRRLPRGRIELSAFALASSYRDGSVALGGRLSWTRLDELRGENRYDESGRSPRVLCAPVVCGPAVGRMASGAWLGNERGFELGIGAWVDGGMRIAARSVLRNAISSRWRFHSAVGAWLPEVVVSLGVGVDGDDRDVALVWSPAAFSLALTSWLAIDAEPIRVGVTFDGDSVLEASLGLRVML